MTHTGRKRKRYLLLSSDSKLTDGVKRDVAEFIMNRYPRTGKNSLVWMENHLIVRSENSLVQQLRSDMEGFRSGELRMKSVCTSGSISKLKRLANR